MAAEPSPARSLLNPGWRPDRAPAPAGSPVAEVVRFHRGRPGYRPTPLWSLPVLAGELGLVGVAIKDESARFGLPAFKILGASWAIERALRIRPRARTLVAASAGNHGRAVARVATERGLACRIHLPADAAPARVRAIEAEGAEVVRAAGGYDLAVARAAADAVGDLVLISDCATDPAVEPVDPSPADVVDGYATLFAELDDCIDDSARIVLVVPMGVGSLAAAAVRWAAGRSAAGLRAAGPPAAERGRCAVIGVEPVTAAGITASLRAGRPVTVPTPGTTMAGLNCPAPSASAWPDLRAGLAGTVLVDDVEVALAQRELAATGIAFGECGAAPVAGLRRLMVDDAGRRLRAAAQLPDAVVVCLGTEGRTDPDSHRASAPE